MPPKITEKKGRVLNVLQSEGNRVYMIHLDNNEVEAVIENSLDLHVGDRVICYESTSEYVIIKDENV